MSASPTPAVEYRAFATAKLVRRAILEELRREPGAQVWGRRITHSPQLLQYASAKMLEELHEVLAITGNPPGITRISAANLPHLMEELADVMEVSDFLADNFLPRTYRSVAFSPERKAVQWSSVLGKWHELALAPLSPSQEAAVVLKPLLEETGILMALLLDLLRAHNLTLVAGHPLLWPDIHAARDLKALKKGRLVPFYLEAVSLPATSQWCAVFAQKLPELNPASLNPNTRVPPHSLAA